MSEVNTPPEAQVPTTSSMEICKSGDDRTLIPVWTPRVDSKGHVSAEPPQSDGQITYIELFADSDLANCSPSELNTFTFPNDRNDWRSGGLNIAMRGNTQFANGTCYFKGYYMNETIMGMNQGYLSTLFKAIPKEEIVLSGKYCLGKAID